jgi:serine/threonine protein kinase
MYRRRQYVAIKVLRAERLTHKDYAAYLAEVELINKLKHPHVLRFVGVCWAQPNATLVTEWMAGGSLYDMLHAHENDEVGPSQPRPLSLLQALRFGEQIASAVSYVHTHGVVHRDIKSCNILLDRERTSCKVADFGLSRHLATHGKSMTVVTGTFRWMAPELLTGNGKYGTAVDVYSFGVVIWEMLSGQLPYPLLSPIEAAVRVVRDNLRPDMPDAVPAELAAAVIACWDADVAKRPAAGDLEASLRTWRAAQEAASPEAAAGTEPLKRNPSDTQMLCSLSSTILAQEAEGIDSASAVVPPTPQRKPGLLASFRGMMCCAQPGGSQ